MRQEDKMNTEKRIFALLAAFTLIFAVFAGPVSYAVETLPEAESVAGYNPETDSEPAAADEAPALLSAEPGDAAAPDENFEYGLVEVYSDSIEDAEDGVMLFAAPADGETDNEIAEVAEENSEADIIGGADKSTEIILTSAGSAEEEPFEGNAIGKWLDKTFSGFDYAIFTFFSKLHNDVLTTVTGIYTHLGDTEFAIPMLLLAAVLCLFKKTRKIGLTLGAAIVIGTLFTNVVLKNVCGRVRPYVTMSGNADFMKWYTEAGAHIESDNSFPSGHTTCAFEIATALFLTVKNNKIRWIFPLYAILIACSRLYLMVHYPTDVLAGVIVGICAGLIAFAIAKLIMKNEKIANLEIKKKA